MSYFTFKQCVIQQSKTNPIPFCGLELWYDSITEGHMEGMAQRQKQRDKFQNSQVALSVLTSEIYTGWFNTSICPVGIFYFK